MYVSCNTTMAHLLAGIDPSPIGQAPFTPVFTNTFLLENTKLNAYITNIVILPSVGAYLGSDILAGILASRMLETNKNALLIDIGTNGEIILKTGQQLYGCSTAAGPAFEGGRISCGMAAIPGAINEVQLIDGKVKLKTVEGKPKGICGCGLVDLIAVMRKEKLLDCSGALQKSSSPLSKKIKNDVFYVTGEIYLSQKDVREFQLAKSAIISGILSLATTARISLDQIETVYLAGGFGFYLNLDNAYSVGLLPETFRGKVRSIGNASGMGAKIMSDTSRQYRQTGTNRQSRETNRVVQPECLLFLLPIICLSAGRNENYECPDLEFNTATGFGLQGIKRIVSPFCRTDKNRCCPS